MTERRDPSATSGWTVALYVLVGIAPLVSIALASTAGAAFAVWFYALTLVVLGVVALAIPPTAAQVDHDSRPGK